MPRVMMFHISGDEPDKLIPFYQELFGWEFQSDLTPDGTWYIKTGESNAPGIDGILHMREWDASVVNSVPVVDMEEMVAKVMKNGGRIIDKREIPQVGLLTLFADPQGNIFQMMQPHFPTE